MPNGRYLNHEIAAWIGRWGSLLRSGPYGDETEQARPGVEKADVPSLGWPGLSALGYRQERFGPFAVFLGAGFGAVSPRLGYALFGVGQFLF